MTMVRTFKSTATRMHTPRRSVLAAALSAVGLAAAGFTATAGLAAPPADRALAAPVASAAAVLPVADKAKLHLNHSSGSVIYEEGAATGQLPGTVATHFKLTARLSSITTIHPRGGGSITLSGKGVLHSSGAFSSFSETMTVISATGRYAHARGSCGLYGVVNRHNWTMTVQSTGRLTY